MRSGGVELVKHLSHSVLSLKLATPKRPPDPRCPFVDDVQSKDLFLGIRPL
jgi:D-serine dehydratase